MYNTKKHVTDLFADMTEFFAPRIIGEVNDAFVKIARLKGDDIPWHSHDGEDEMFYVLSGSMTMLLRDGTEEILGPGDMYIVKQGTEHRVYAEQECRIMLFENKTTKHTGVVESKVTKKLDEQLY